MVCGYILFALGSFSNGICTTIHLISFNTFFDVLIVLDRCIYA